VPASLEVFDPAEQGMVSGSRDATTVAPQRSICSTIRSSGVSRSPWPTVCSLARTSTTPVASMQRTG
jgi:hypothetical protein